MRSLQIFEPVLLGQDPKSTLLADAVELLDPYIYLEVKQQLYCSSLAKRENAEERVENIIAAIIKAVDWEDKNNDLGISFVSQNETKKENLPPRNNVLLLSDALSYSVLGWMKRRTLGRERFTALENAYDELLGSDLASNMRATFPGGLEDDLVWGIRGLHIGLLGAAISNDKQLFDELAPLAELMFETPVLLCDCTGRWWVFVD